jgi:hypothetical protein
MAGYPDLAALADWAWEQAQSTHNCEMRQRLFELSRAARAVADRTGAGLPDADVSAHVLARQVGD